MRILLQDGDPMWSPRGLFEEVEISQSTGDHIEHLRPFSRHPAHIVATRSNRFRARGMAQAVGYHLQLCLRKVAMTIKVVGPNGTFGTRCMLETRTRRRGDMTGTFGVPNK